MRQSSGNAMAGTDQRLLAAALVVGLAGCAGQPESAASLLEPTAGAPVWPAAPEISRYAFVRTLIGERDFVTPGRAASDGLQSALRWLAGLVVGEPDYIELRRPVSGMTDAEGRVYVVDASHRAVMVFDLADRRLLKWGQATRGVSFVSPVGIVDDGRGGVLVTDSELGAVYRLEPDGEPAGRFGADVLTRPTGIARDDLTGAIYVADTARHDVKVFDDDGVLVDILGAQGIGAGTFNSPTHLAFRDGRLYVSDTLNFRVQVFDRAGDDRLAFGQLGLFVGDLTRPKGVAVGCDGRIYVVESYYDHLLVYDNAGRLLLPIGGTGQGIGEFYLPSGVWTDSGGRVYVADMFNGRVVVFREIGLEAAP